MSDTEPQGKSAEIVKAAFGAKNRGRLLQTYFASAKGANVAPSSAWAHVYRLLLWADQTTGLAHCYESDKSQPGKNWYSRALAFHDWTSTALAVPASGLAEEIDWLFRRATTDLASEVLHNAVRLAAAAAKQRKPYEGKGLPNPGEDPELVAIVREVLGEHLRTRDRRAHRHAARSGSGDAVPRGEVSEFRTRAPSGCGCVGARGGVCDSDGNRVSDGEDQRQR